VKAHKGNPNKATLQEIAWLLLWPSPGYIAT